MERGLQGEKVPIGVLRNVECEAFIPNPLPPNPPLVLSDQIQELLDRAHLALGRLDNISNVLPDTDLFIFMYSMKEALLSSQIEGTKTEFSDLLLFEIDEEPSVPLSEAQEVRNYVYAIEHGLRRLREGMPLCNRMLKEIHGILLKTGRGSDKRPGDFRVSQNFIDGTWPGDARFVPPPPDDIKACMRTFESFLNDEPLKTRTVLKAALAHAQFEAIHPFTDGNGRLGRVLITLIFCNEGILKEPLLYLSLYFKANRNRYIDLLYEVSQNGIWEEWIAFFVEGVRSTAESCVNTAQRLLKLFEEDRERIQALGKSAGSVFRVHHALQRNPVASISGLAQTTHLAVPTVGSALDSLIKLEMVIEITKKKRNRLFVYKEYLAILSEGTEPL